MISLAPLAAPTHASSSARMSPPSPEFALRISLDNGIKAFAQTAFHLNPTTTMEGMPSFDVPAALSSAKVGLSRLSTAIESANQMGLGFEVSQLVQARTDAEQGLRLLVGAPNIRVDYAAVGNSFQLISESMRSVLTNLPGWTIPIA